MIFCTSCGIKASNDDKFCRACGHVLPDEFVSETQSTSVKRKPAKEAAQDKRPLIVIGSFFLLVICSMSVLIYKGVTSEVKSIINIEDDSAAHAISSCANCTALTVEGVKYPLQKAAEDETSLAHHLLELAQQSAGQEGTLTFFDENDSSGDIFISLDISGSVQRLVQQDKDRGAEETYADVVLRKIKNYFAEDRSLKPGDTLMLQYYGPSAKDNPCRNILTIHYLSPEYKADFAYSDRRNGARIIVKDKLPDTTRKEGSDVYTNSMDQVLSEISTFYEKGLAEESEWCHSDTRLNEHLSRLSDLSREDTNGSKHFVLANDGDFSWGDLYVSSEDSEQLDLIETTGIQLCNAESDSFTVLGMNYNGNLGYRSSIQEFFKKLLVPCSVIFRPL